MSSSVLPRETHVPPAPARANDLAAATPASRDRYVDLLRAASLVVVVLGHWLMAAVEHRHGRLTGGNLLQIAPATQLLTWVFQVMPIFFLVGGFSNAASWVAARRDGRSYGAWLQGRLARLTGPAVALVLAWSAVTAVAGALGVDGAALAKAGRLVALPLWFLAVYVLVVAAAPAAVSVHRRFGLRVPVALAAGVFAVDLAHWQLGVPVVGSANFALVWLFAHQLGILWWDGRLGGSRWTPAAFVAGGLVTLALLTTQLGYPLSMVGGPGATRTNNSPPSAALVALAVWQAGAVLALAPAARRGLQRPKVWTAVITANAMAMTLYLWHLTALALAAVVLLPGWFPQPAIGSGSWWLLRPLWLAVLALALVPLVLAFGRFERSARPSGRPVRSPAALAGTVLIAAGFSALAAGGFSEPGLPMGIAWRALAPLCAGIALLRAPVARPTLGHGR